MQVQRTSAVFLGLMILIVSFQGCASIPENTRVMLSEDERSSLEIVGVIAVGPMPEPEGLGPVTSVGETVIGGGAGLLIGGAVGLGIGALVAGSLACGPAILACVAAASGVMAVGTAVGAAVGTTAGVIIASDDPLPSQIEVQLENALAGALGGLDLSEQMKDQFLSAGLLPSPRTMIDLGRIGTLPDAGSPGYKDLVPDDAKHVLQVGIAQIALAQIEDEETEFSLLINAYGALATRDGQKELWSNNQIVYVSEPDYISNWTAPKSDYLRTEIDEGLRALGVEIGAQLFGE